MSSRRAAFDWRLLTVTFMFIAVYIILAWWVMDSTDRVNITIERDYHEELTICEEQQATLQDNLANCRQAQTCNCRCAGENTAFIAGVVTGLGIAATIWFFEFRKKREKGKDTRS